MWPFRTRVERPPPVRSRTYGKRQGRVQTFAGTLLFTIAWAAAVLGAACIDVPPLGASERPVKIVAFGDSLTAGHGLAAEQSFPAKLAQALQRKGISADVVNAGVSGNTAADGAARLDWSVPDGTDAVILELGANDALRGSDPKATRAALDAIIRRLQERRIAVLLAGMLAPRNFGEDYVNAFDAIYPELAAKYDLILYPFILDGVAGDRALNLSDGIHPTATGVDIIASRMLPKVEELIGRVKSGR